MRKILRSLISPQAAAVLVGGLLILGVLGTLIPQGRDPGDFLRQFPRCGPWMLRAGMNDLYRSPLLAACLSVTTLALLMCTLARLQAVWRFQFSRLEGMTPEEIKEMPVREELAGGPHFIPESGGWQTRKLPDGGRICRRVSGTWALLGGLFIHLGLLCLLSGGLTDAFLGGAMTVWGREGEKIPIPSLAGFRASLAADRLRVQARLLQDLSIPSGQLIGLHQEIARLDTLVQAEMTTPPFKLILDQIGLESGSDLPPAMRISVQASGTVVASGALAVNAPLSHGPYTFFPQAWKSRFSEVVFGVTTAPGRASPQILIASPGVPIKPDWSPYSFVLLDFWPDFRIEQDRFVSASNELNRPVARLAVYDQEGKAVGRVWAFAPDRDEPIPAEISDFPYRFVIRETRKTGDAGIQVSHLPGLPVLVLGGLLLCIGLGFSFLVECVEEWVYVRFSGRMTLAVTGNGHPASQRRYLERLWEFLATGAGTENGAE